MTTNYDDTLEQAFINTKEEFDLVFYMLEDDHQGRFFHRLPNGRQYPIDIPNEYGNLSLDLRTIILKIHGAINRSNPEEDSFVIIEDHYIDFLTSADISKLMPVTLVAKLRKCNFLFLGYSLCDWNFRVILRRINIERNHSFNSWSVQLYLDAFEQEYWARQGVRIFEVDLDEYVLQLSKYL